MVNILFLSAFCDNGKLVIEAGCALIFCFDRNLTVCADITITII